ncbi:MAG: hypothetical protein HKN87_08955 [Saprospiraceae bacterium]|nr:hypothetical protein [Saprospiraceae bacterium]
MRYLIIPVVLFINLNLSFGQERSIAVSKIYASERHDAFTSLIKFKEYYYCAFRSGEHHVYGKDGGSMILRTTDVDNNNWQQVDYLTKSGVDLRDPKLSITPDGRIMALVGGSTYEQKELLGMQTQVSFSDTKGSRFSQPQPIVVPDEVRTNFDWLWSVTWHHDNAYGVLSQRKAKTSKLVKSSDGIHYEFVCDLGLDGRPNEARVRFDEADRMYILHRREEADQKGCWGWSDAPYVDWTWQQLAHRLGGPDFIILPGGAVLAGSRIYHDTGNKVGILYGDISGIFNEVVELPSGGDCSYPSFLVEPNRILMSYYSSHEGTADIYLAQIQR